MSANWLHFEIALHQDEPWYFSRSIQLSTGPKLFVKEKFWKNKQFSTCNWLLENQEKSMHVMLTLELLPQLPKQLELGGHMCQF